MSIFFEKIIDSYNYVFYDLADERSRDMFPSGAFLMILLPSYVYFSTYLGPKLMKDVKPFKLKNVMFVYNVFQIYICGYMLHLALKGGWPTHYKFRCEPVDMTENPRSRSMLNATWWYTTVKIIDLLDTVFFVLRKKDRQISFLHLFHHTLMPCASFIGLKYYPNGHGILTGVINSIVHMVMYFYYLLAGLGPQYQKYLWWKKYLTAMQLVQFTIIVIHNIVALCDSTCTYPRWVSWLLIIQGTNFIYMFGSFYYVNYIKTSKKPVKGNNNGTAKMSVEKSKVH